MFMAIGLLLWLLLAKGLSSEGSVGVTFSSRLVHRFSKEAKIHLASRGNGSALQSWPERNSSEYLRLLLRSDVTRQRMRLGSQYETLYPSEGGETFSFGNVLYWAKWFDDLGIGDGDIMNLTLSCIGGGDIRTETSGTADVSVLHYAWIDIGTPNVSFLVALDAGSDMLWVPCDCIECASLSAGNYNVLDRDLNLYTPSLSNTSRHLPCGHKLCDQQSFCKGSKDPCPYSVQYATDNTTSSGILFEDKLHLASDGRHTEQNSVQASIILGCGRKQTGEYLEGASPDGVLGLGPGNISVPSLLAKAGLTQNSFSICLGENESGRIIFGDQGHATQHSTPFLPINGEFAAYMVGAESFCVGNLCLKETRFQLLIDSGSSFTFLPNEVYQKVVMEFDKQVNATRIILSESEWDYCYNVSSQELINVPPLKLVFSRNQTLLFQNPIFTAFASQEQDYTVFCLPISPTDNDYATIGQNYLMGYRMVFDRENLRFGWSRWNCQDKASLTSPFNGGSPNPLPANQQQSVPNARAVPPAIAGHASAKRSAATAGLISKHSVVSMLLICHLWLWSYC